MKIPNDFREALERAHNNAGELNKLFIEHKSFIMRLVKHAQRYRHWAVISDEDDLYQEACIWLVNSLWEWEEEHGVGLAEYVVYHVGVRLKNQISKEQRQKRHPEKPLISIHPHQTNSGNISKHNSKEEQGSIALEDKIRGYTPDPESLLIVRRAYQRIERELPLLARELLESLMLESGNLSAASRRILRGGRVRIVKGMSEDAFRQALRRNFLTELRTVLEAEDIIPADGTAL